MDLKALSRIPSWDWPEDAGDLLLAALRDPGAPEQNRRLTAVFCMEYLRGFDREIVEALEDEDPRIEYHAVRAAGAHGVAGAWRHVRAIVAGDTSDKALLLAAIAAVATIRPDEADEVLAELADDEDEEIAEAVEAALALRDPFGDFDDEIEDEEDDKE